MRLPAKRDAKARAAAERDEISGRAEWLHARADDVAKAESALAAVWRGVVATEAALANAFEHVAHSALERIGTSRERLERVAAELTSDLHAHGARTRRLAAEHRVSEDELQRLIGDVAGELPPREATRCRTELPLATLSELMILGDLVEEGLTHEQLVHLLEGGHLLVPGRDLVERWAALDGVHPRTSSHYHPRDDPKPGPVWLEKSRARLHDMKAKPEYGQQYGLKGRFVHEVLFGPGPRDTMFVQLERAAPSKARLAEHIGDWVEYRVTHRNQGPYGSTVETDAHPMQAAEGWRVDESLDVAARIEAAATEARRIGAVLASVADEIATEAPFQIVVSRVTIAHQTDTDLSEVAATLADVTTSVAELATSLRAGAAG